jgi:hypothetical protein
VKKKKYYIIFGVVLLLLAAGWFVFERTGPGASNQTITMLAERFN